MRMGIDTAELAGDIRKHLKQVAELAERSGVSEMDYFDEDEMEGHANQLLVRALMALEGEL